MRPFFAFVTLTLALALVACSGKKGPTTPTVPVPRGPVTGDAMNAYFQARFPAAVADGSLVLDFGSEGVASEVVAELKALGIEDMSGVAALVPNDYDTKGFNAVKASEEPSTNIAGLMRDVMMIKDTRAYFEKAWQHHWVSSGPEDFPGPAAYGVDFSIMEELGVFGGGMDPCDGGEDPCDWEGDPCGDPCGD